VSDSDAGPQAGNAQVAGWLRDSSLDVCTLAVATAITLPALLATQTHPSHTPPWPLPISGQRVSSAASPARRGPRACRACPPYLEKPGTVGLLILTTRRQRNCRSHRPAILDDLPLPSFQRCGIYRITISAFSSASLNTAVTFGCALKARRYWCQPSRTSFCQHSIHCTQRPLHLHSRISPLPLFCRAPVPNIRKQQTTDKKANSICYQSAFLIDRVICLCLPSADLASRVGLRRDGRPCRSLLFRSLVNTQANPPTHHLSDVSILFHDARQVYVP
jgi:hypothetical protein